MDYSKTLHTTSVNVFESVKEVNPSLIEPGVKYFLNETLQGCKNTKIHFYNNMFNIGLFICLSLGIATFLYVKYKGKQNTREKELRNRQVAEYIQNKIKMLEQDKRKKHDEMITNIPEFESEHHIRNKIFL